MCGGGCVRRKKRFAGKAPPVRCGGGSGSGEGRGGGALRPSALSSALASLERAQGQAHSIGEERVGGKHCKGNKLDCASSGGNWS